MDKAIRELIERVIELTRSYAIWWELVNPENRQKYQNAITGHEDFFATTAHAHFQSIVVVLYQLFDKRKGTKSIHNLFNTLEAAHSKLAEKLRLEVQPHEQILKKVFAIRNNVYAHHNALLSPEEVFANASLSVNALGSLVSLVENLIAEIAEATGVGESVDLTVEFERRADYAREDLQFVLGTFLNMFGMKEKGATADRGG